MKLTEAFNRYAASGAAPATAYRSEFYAILRPMFGDVDVKHIDKQRVKDSFDNSSATLSSKIRAAALLIYILGYAAESGFCNKPDFSTSIVWQKKDKEQFDKAKAIISRMRPAAPTTQPQQVIVKDTPRKVKDTPKMEKKTETKKKKPAGKPMRKVCKLDPKTLQVLATYDSVKAAAEAGGLKKLCGPLSKHQKGNGFYWCYAEEVETFKPAPPPGRAKTTLKRAKQKFEEAITQTIQEMLAKLSDDDLLTELRKRGWHGDISKTITVTL